MKPLSLPNERALINLINLLIQSFHKAFQQGSLSCCFLQRGRDYVGLIFLSMEEITQGLSS